MTDSAKEPPSDSTLPNGWAKQRLGVWGFSERKIRLSVHQSKVTRKFTAIASSGDFFLSRSLLGDLATAIAEAGQLGTLLHLRLAGHQCADSAVS